MDWNLALISNRVSNFCQFEARCLIFNLILKAPSEIDFANLSAKVRSSGDAIACEFDFEKVQTAMNVLGWKWVGQDVTIDMLKTESIRLLKDAAKLRLVNLNDEHWELGIICGIGGLQAIAYCDEDKTKITSLDLKFVLTEWDVDLEDIDNN